MNELMRRAGFPSHPLSPPPMDSISLLTRSGVTALTPDEEALLVRELSAAYHMDEAAATSRDVQRIAEKIRERMHSPPPAAIPQPKVQG